MRIRAKSLAAALTLLLSAAPAEAISFSRPPPPPVPGSASGHRCLNYPPGERLVPLQGDTTLDLRIDKTGRVARAVVVRSSGDARLDKAALACVTTWTYPPARHNGRRVSVQRRVMVRWRVI